MWRNLAAVIFLVFFLSGCGGKKPYTPLPQNTVVLALGDSITYGTGASQGEDYPARLAALTGWQVVNAGVPGDVAAGGRERLPGLLEEHHPKLVIVELGGNDFLRKTEPAVIKAQLDAILTEIKAAGIPVVVIGVPRPSLIGVIGGLNADPLYEELAKQHQAVLVEDVLPKVLSDPALKSDQIHPNAEGYVLLAREIYAALVHSGLAAKGKKF